LFAARQTASRRPDRDRDDAPACRIVREGISAALRRRGQDALDLRRRRGSAILRLIHTEPGITSQPAKSACGNRLHRSRKLTACGLWAPGCFKPASWQLAATMSVIALRTVL